MGSVPVWHLKTDKQFFLVVATKGASASQLKSAASNIRLSVLKNRSDFLHTQKNGQRIRPTSWLLINFIVNQEGAFRCGWTLPRQVGPAVVRNRLKRWSRVYFRARVLRGETLPIDLNLVFRKADKDEFYKKLNYDAYSQVLDRAWEQLRFRLKENSSHAGRTLSKPGSRPRPRRSVPV
jgi:ribonuclease P protein component